MRHLIVGMGEIGQAIHGIFPEAQTHDKEQKPIELPIDVLHICFPYSPTFVADILRYMDLYKPDHIVIYSTVPIGTTKKIKSAVHSPVEGKHPQLEESIRLSPRWIGANNESAAMFFKQMFRDKGMTPRVLEDSDYTEFLKLRSTAKYGINLVWTDYEAKVAKDLGMNFAHVKQFDKDYNKLYQTMGMDWAQRYILDPPNGKIGGHCVVPNAKLLNESHPDSLLDEIEGME